MLDPPPKTGSLLPSYWLTCIVEGFSEKERADKLQCEQAGSGLFSAADYGTTSRAAPELVAFAQSLLHLIIVLSFFCLDLISKHLRQLYFSVQEDLVVSSQ